MLNRPDIDDRIEHIDRLIEHYHQHDPGERMVHPTCPCEDCITTRPMIEGRAPRGRGDGVMAGADDERTAVDPMTWLSAVCADDRLDAGARAVATVAALCVGEDGVLRMDESELCRRAELLLDLGPAR